MEKLLYSINKACKEGLSPAEWKYAVLVLILKPGREPDSLGSYRLIALKALSCKVIERMINERSIYRLEQKGWGFFIIISEWL